MTEQIQLPAPPTDGELSKEFPSRPDYSTISNMIEGIAGKSLFDDRDFGPAVLEQIQQSHIEIRNYLKNYDRKSGTYWDTPFGAVEKAGESFGKVRTNEINRWDGLMVRMVTIMVDYAAARTDAENATRLRIEQQQREADEKECQERIDALNRLAGIASLSGDSVTSDLAIQEIEAIKSTPSIPTVVTPQQATAVANLPAMPKGLISSKKPGYEHTVIDQRKLIAWLNANPGYIDRFVISPMHIALRHTVFPKESGIETREKRTIQNRGK